MFAYSASKAAVVNLTQNVARELAPLDVRVNALCPGFFPAEQNRKILDPGRVEKIMTQTPMGRFGEPEELVGATLLHALTKGGEFHHGGGLLRRRRVHGHAALRAIRAEGPTDAHPIECDGQPGSRGPRRPVRVLGRPAGGLPQGAGTRVRRRRGLPAFGRLRWTRPCSATLLDDHGLTLAGRRHGAGWVVRPAARSPTPTRAARPRRGEFIRSIIDLPRPARCLGDHRLDAGAQRRWGRRRHGGPATWPTRSKTWAITPRSTASRLLYEPLNRYETNLVNTRRSGRALLESLSTKNVALLADLFHMNIEERDLAGGHPRRRAA